MLLECMLAVTNFRVACTSIEVSMTATYSKHPLVFFALLGHPRMSEVHEISDNATKKGLWIDHRRSGG